MQAACEYTFVNSCHQRLDEGTKNVCGPGTKTIVSQGVALDKFPASRPENGFLYTRAGRRLPLSSTTIIGMVMMHATAVHTYCFGQVHPMLSKSCCRLAAY